MPRDVAAAMNPQHNRQVYRRLSGRINIEVETVLRAQIVTLGSTGCHALRLGAHHRLRLG